MPYPNHTLHLVKQTNLSAPPPWITPPTSKGNSNETTSSRFCVLSNYPSNPLSRAVAKVSSSKSGNPMKTHTAKGEVTLAGLRRGYIQASPFYPATNLHIGYQDDRIKVLGTRADGVPVSKIFIKLADARKYLYATH